MKNTYEKFNIQIGKKIMKKRLQRGYTREYLAEMADISAKFLYEIEIGKKGCSVYVFFASTFWRKMQNIFGECCISKLEKVARPRLAAILPAT